MAVAMAENRVIGRDGGLPWHLSGDLQYFKRVTMGKPMIMGRKTFESIGRPLPGRLNIVVTRDATYATDNVMVVHSLEQALDAARERAEADGIDEVMIIGGGQIYGDALPVTDRVYLTEVHASVDGDTVFPDLAEDQWRETAREMHPGNKAGEPGYSFVILDRITEQTGG
ncbi:MAG: dihydrofolate reductase [Rhodospirillales bacterium]|nr:dihydrofolate reductase [Rhodospirillales bacterium]